MVFVCHITFEDHVIKTFYDFMVIPFKVSHHRTKFGGHRHSGKGDIMVLLCQEILQNHMIKRSRYFMGRLSRQVTILQRLFLVEEL